MNENQPDRFAELEEVLGYRFSDRDLLRRALRHGSADNARNDGSYQRLEFLGDAVLGHAIALLLYHNNPQADEGLLTRMRSHLVRSSSLASKAAWLGLDGWIEVGPSEQRDRGRERVAMLEDVLEAVIGAIALDGGWEAAWRFISGQFAEDAEEIDESTLLLADAKSTLNQAAQVRGLATPEYLEVPSGGSAHRPVWAFTVTWNGETVARGEGRTKRDAQQQAARRALVRLGLLPESENGR